MNIVKALHPGLLHKTFQYKGKSHFVVSLMWGFRLDSGEPILEQKMWETIGELLGKNEMFDSGMPKVNGEFLVSGNYYSPKTKTVTAGKVSARLGSIFKELAIVGNHRWIKAVGVAITKTDPRPFTEMPISYEYAFGGKKYDKNPVGKGFGTLITESGKKIHPLPNVQYPNQLIGSPGDRPEPAGFSPVDMMWKQRFSKIGTYDQKYIESRLPGLADDIDLTFFNDAAPDQWMDGFFKGDEPFEIVNMHPEKRSQKGRLPGVVGRCFVNQEADGSVLFKEIPVRLDTVRFFPKENMAIIIHRGTLGVRDDDGEDVKQLLIAHENIEDPSRDLEHYRRELALRTDPEEGFKYMLNTAALLPEGCRCGFEIMQEESGLPLEMLNQKNIDAFTNKKREEVDTVLEKGEKDLKQELKTTEFGPDVDKDEIFNKINRAGELGDEPPEAKKMKELIENIVPGAVDNPENFDLSRLNLKGFDDLKAYTAQLTDDKRKEAEDKLRADIEEKKSGEQTEETRKAISELEKALEDMERPPVLPRFDCDEQLEKTRSDYEEIQKQMMIMKSMGISDEQIEQTALDFDELEGYLKDGLDKAQDGYRTGAHFLGQSRSPHEGEEAEIAAKLIEDHRAGAETAGGDYAFVDLSGRNLSGIDLSGAYLEYANLAYADFTDANLENAILAFADLTGAVFRRANLKGANIGAAKIKDTAFTDSNLTGAVLGKSRIDDAVFNRCKIVDRMETFLDTEFKNAQFTDCDMKKNNFIEADVSGCVFRESDLSESNFIKPVMQDTVFERAVLNKVNFIEADGKSAVFDSAVMRNARFVGGCDLSGASFVGADASESNLRDCNLQKCDFSKAFLQNTDFSGSNLVRAQFVRASAIGAQFNKADLSHAKLHRINLMEGSMYKAKIVGARFFEANLYSVGFFKCILGDTDFTDAYLEKTVLKGWG